MHTADLYDAVYSFKDYAEEVSVLNRYLDDLGISSGSMLELACGTGEYLKGFERFNRTGIDLCSRSLEIAQSKIPEMEAFQQDMTTFSTGKKYDVVLAVFGAVGYIGPDKLIEFFRRCQLHLKDRGVLVLEPWLTKDDFEPGTFLMEGRIAGQRFNRLAKASDQNGMSVLEFTYIYVDGNSVQTSYSEDRLFLHDRKMLLTCLDEANFEISGAHGGFLEKSTIFILKKAKKD